MNPGRLRCRPRRTPASCGSDGTVLADRVEITSKSRLAREVLAEPIEDHPLPQRTHDLDILGIAHRRHLGLEVVREELNGGRSDEPAAP